MHQKYVNERNSFQHLSFVNHIIIAIFDCFYEDRDTHHYENLSLWTQDEELLLHISSLLFLTIEVSVKNFLFNSISGFEESRISNRNAKGKFG